MTVDRSTSRIQTMFGEIAPRYDFLNHTLSCGIDTHWRQRVVKILSPPADAKILDVCTGTGDLALAFWRKYTVEVTGVDFCEEMLEIGRKKIAKRGAEDKIHLSFADATELPFQENTFDFVTVAFGLRNTQDYQKSLSEMVRVCRRGGKVAILEFSTPRRFPVRQFYQFYFKYILPRIGQMVAKNHFDAYHYLPASVGEFPQGEKLTELMENAGLKDVEFRLFTMGIATLYLGIKE
ncbi:MAG: bifunctional demethylmenaquinone methyltransferase/2-methoxy-6-polyprenyl-1,4-benzoquinol methylase UbiE [Planctomycetia bacterium]|nr:bifunctional demethylmenaquinone methyltransferase/2-methoxy-6-polyprenyl-1,4-benzoquinol methylase UbiE [Planctomycetia bacterium]